MKESMVIYESAYKAINYLPDEESQLEAYRGLMEYGFYGILPESKNPFVNMVYVQAIPSMRCAAERYEKAREDGKKGGRPTEVSTEEIIQMKDGGMTNKQIAEKLGCSEKNIEKRVSTFKKGHPTNPTNPLLTQPSDSRVESESYPTNPTNLTVSYTVSSTSTVSDTESASVTSSGETDVIRPEEKGDVVAAAESSPSDQGATEKLTHYRHVSGDGLPGRRIRDLSSDEAKEIKAKLSSGVPYLDIEREYDMRRGTVTKDFTENWRAFLAAKANGRV